ncbi:glycoside hydrolase family 43 protein [Microbacterium sp. RG1]|uniref:glycoside hydrolase family 43 protein n=1 Tax=Microbacterium sp. RG1 TaxID=2489212 RepID=UPI0013757588|nr:glycoside hydrolase family 43 protein [Microbacterium sp. RG1]
MGRYRNPILPGCHPDPSICRFGDRYVLVTSSFEYLPGLPVHVSDDLVNWTLAGHVLHRPGQIDLSGLTSSSGTYAPTVREVNGRLVVVCTVVGPEEGDWAGRTGHFLVTADAPEGPWSDPVWIDGVGGFDPSITVDGDRVWLCGTREAVEGYWPGRTEVWVAELDLASGALLSAPVVIWTGAAVGAVWAEGPHLLPHPDGGWMLLVAEGGTDLEHAVCVAYADRIEGPYVGDAGNPRLSHRDLGPVAPIVAVGHADLVDDIEGRSWATVLALHPVDGRRGILGRRTSLVPVGWADGRPLFAPGIGRVEEVVTAESVPDQRPWPTRVEERFTTERLDLEWNGAGRLPEEIATWGTDGLLLPGGAEPSRTARVSFLGRRLPDENSEASLRLRITPADDGFRAGVLLRVSDAQQLELSVTGAGEAIAVLAGAEIGRLPLGRDAVGDELELTVRIRNLTASLFVGEEEVAFCELDVLAPQPPRGFIGAWVGPVAVGSGEARITRFALSVG